MLKAVLKIIRPVNSIITFISVIIAAVISSSISAIDYKVILIAVVSSLSLAAGNVINDILDFEIDKVNRPERPLPSGLISLIAAKAIYYLLVIPALVISIFVGMEFFIIVLAGNMLLFLYSYRLKRIILIGNLTVSLLTGLPLMLGAMSVENISGGIVPAFFAAFVNFVREIVKDMEDVKGDSTFGVVTFPQKAGLKKTSYLVICFIFILMILTTIPYFLHWYKIEYFLTIMVTVNPLFVLAVKKMASGTSAKVLSSVSNLLKINMLLGLLAFLLGA